MEISLHLKPIAVCRLPFDLLPPVTWLPAVCLPKRTPDPVRGGDIDADTGQIRIRIQRQKRYWYRHPTPATTATTTPLECRWRVDPRPEFRLGCRLSAQCLLHYYTRIYALQICLCIYYNSWQSATAGK